MPASRSAAWPSCAASAPTAPPIMSSGARTPPDVPEPREKAHISDLTRMMPRMSAMGALPVKQSGDVVVANAQAAGKDETSDADANTSQGRPPHPVQGQPLECVFKGIHHAAHAGCDKTKKGTEE